MRVSSYLSFRTNTGSSDKHPHRCQMLRYSLRQMFSRKGNIVFTIIRFFDQVQDVAMADKDFIYGKTNPLVQLQGW